MCLLGCENSHAMATPLVSHTVGNGSNNFSSSHTEKGFYYVIKLPALLMLTVVSSKKGEKKSLHSLQTFVTTGGERSVGQATYPKKSFLSNQLAQGNMPEFCNTPEELMG